MLFIKKTILVLLLPLLAFTTFHKYYVSVTQIEYVKKQQSVQIISRIFLDDFEDVLQARYNEKLFLLTTNGNRRRQFLYRKIPENQNDHENKW